MGINDAIEKLVTISDEKLGLLNNLVVIWERLSSDIIRCNQNNVTKYTNERFDMEVLISKLDLEFYRTMAELETFGINGFDKVDSIVYPNIKNLKTIVGDILEVEEKLSNIKLRNNQLLSNIERDSTTVSEKAISAYKKQKLNKQ